MPRTAGSNPHSKIVAYFLSAPVAEARILFNSLQGILKSRENEVMNLNTAAAPAAKTRKPRKSSGAKRGRKPKTAAAPLQVQQAGEAVPAAAILGENAA